METIVFAIAFSFLFTVIILPIIISFANSKGIFVKKSYRKIHKGDVSSLGGIAIFIPVILSVILFSDFINIKEIKYLLVASSLIFVFGLRDDLFDVKPIQKLAGQIITISIVVFLANIRLKSFDGFFGFYELPYWASVFVTFFLMILIINAFNFFDGIDLQASLFSIIVFFTMGIWFYNADQVDMGLVLLSTGASIIAFSIYNFSPARIIMGDTGAMSIGLILAISMVKFINLNTDYSVNDRLENEIVVGLSFMAIPIFDAARVSIIRVSRGKSPFKADKNHVHHLLLKLGWKQNQIAFINASISIFLVLLNLYLQRVISAEVQLLINLIILSVFFASIELASKYKSRS